MMAGTMERFGLSAALLGITIALSIRFNTIQSEPYMDEIFHIPQAQNYCHHNFSHWNKKITTLPGLYIVSFMLLQISRLFSVDSFLSGTDSTHLCSSAFLRSLNIIFMCGNLWLLYQLSYKINRVSNQYSESSYSKERIKLNDKGKKKKKLLTKMNSASTQETKGLSVVEDKTNDQSDIETKAFINAIVLSLFPILYFFTFLYYTDQGSTFMVLLMYWFSFEENHFTAALTGAVAVIFRQTNIIWVSFVAGSSLLRIIQSDLQNINIGLGQLIPALIQTSVSKVRSMLPIAVPYLFVAAGFLVFVLKNNGIVVGDRSSHQACLNFPQLFYFIGFSMTFCFPSFLSPSSLRAFLTFVKQEVIISKKRILCLIFCVLLMACIIFKLTYIHEYLLADNRHYTFYIWRRIFQRHQAIKYLAIPIYFYGAFVMQRHLIQRNSGLWIILFAAAVGLVTIPQKLLEFRYFIIPYLLLRLHIPIPSYLYLSLEMAFYLLINAFTVALFLYKPFSWENESTAQRFMW